MAYIVGSEQAVLVEMLCTCCSIKGCEDCTKRLGPYPQLEALDHGRIQSCHSSIQPYSAKATLLVCKHHHCQHAGCRDEDDMHKPQHIKACCCEQVLDCIDAEVVQGTISSRQNTVLCVIDIAYIIRVLVTVQISDHLSAEMLAGTISSKQNTVLCASGTGYATKDILPVQVSDHSNAEMVAGTIGSKQDAVDYMTWTFLYCCLLCASHTGYTIEDMLSVQVSDHFNAEVVAGTIGSKQDAVDYMTWTFLYRRLLQNPAYYDLEGTEAEDVNEYLSALVERTFTTLQVDTLFCCKIALLSDGAYIHHTAGRRFCTAAGVASCLLLV